MQTVELKDVVKTYNHTRVVDNLSLTLKKGEIFGLLGPNGAGKTTTIRLLLDLIKPDSGDISLFGETMSEKVKDRIGYMPEERGLYEDIPLERCLVYLGTLKGLSASAAKERVETYLEKFDLKTHKNKKIKQLSKGMQQKAQIISTILHQPELIIVDEPFTGLDPVNTETVKQMLRDLSDDGATILMSTHQMHQVDELCDRILLIDNGNAMLYGDLSEIRRQFSGAALLVRTIEELPSIEGVEQVTPHNNAIRLSLSEDTTPQAVLRELVKEDITIEKFEIALPSISEIFIRVVEKGGV